MKKLSDRHIIVGRLLQVSLQNADEREITKHHQWKYVLNFHHFKYKWITLDTLIAVTLKYLHSSSSDAISIQFLPFLSPTQNYLFSCTYLNDVTIMWIHARWSILLLPHSEILHSLFAVHHCSFSYWMAIFTTM